MPTWTTSGTLARRYHTAYSVPAADVTDFTAMAAAGLVILDGGGQPLPDDDRQYENLPHVLIQNVGSEDVYMYHLNDAEAALAHGSLIAAGLTPRDYHDDVSRTPRYLFAASEGGTVRVLAYDWR